MTDFFTTDTEQQDYATINPTELLKVITPQQVLLVLKSLGAQGIVELDKWALIPTICHNPNGTEASLKLYFYYDTKLFHCYTQCGDTFNIYELVRRASEANGVPLNFYEAYYYVLSYVGSKSFVQLQNYYSAIGDKFTRRLGIQVLPEYEAGVLDAFLPFYTGEWAREGISIATMKKYEIGFNVNRNQITIPHRDLAGRLIGVRGRTLDPEIAATFGKYAPIYINGRWLRHHLSLNLYGAYQNQKAIMRHQRAVVFEGEKSVLLSDSLYGDDSVAVAVCGSNLHKVQADILIKQLGVKEIIVAFDKEYTKVGSSDFEKFQRRHEAIKERLSNYVVCRYVMDIDGLLEEKDSPIDKGRAIYERLTKDFLF